uniref:Uncharacterized protein n=1 Tax=Ciona savignyi TaxID=51511 RepID=H2ZDL1_CIOSA
CLTTNNNSQAKTQTLDEYQQKPDITTVTDSKVIPDQSDISSEVESTIYFRKLILKETKRLNEFIEKWDKLSSNNLTQCPLDIRDEIRTVIGKTRLVISERFTQFAKLVDRADGKSGSSNDNRPVLLSDLRGFWDMIYFQVEDVVAKFNALQRISENGWKVSEPEPTLKITPPATAKKTAAKRAPRRKPAHGK